MKENRETSNKWKGRDTGLQINGMGKDDRNKGRLCLIAVFI